MYFNFRIHKRTTALGTPHSPSHHLASTVLSLAQGLWAAVTEGLSVPRGLEPRCQGGPGGATATIQD